MGKGSRVKQERVQVTVTHEPEVPRDWPRGHVGVTLTGAETAECIEITIHGVRHFLHSTTARELNNMLSERLDQWNATARAAGEAEA